MKENKNSKKLKIDTREHIDCVPISSFMRIPVEVNSIVRTTKHKIKTKIKRK